MDKKWNIMDKKDISDKCCQMENAIWNIFQSPSSWINGMNGFIRLVSMDGTWYHHRATDVFIPMTQNYINRLYRADTKPERGAIRVRSGMIFWDYLNQEEALQILPNLPTSNLPNAAESAGLGERCRNKKIFLKDGSVYDMENKVIRPLQWNEEGSVLQICHLEDKHKRNNAVLWHYDIYLWAKAGIIPSVLYASRECWNTMQFLIDNFNKIDFDDFLSLSGMNESMAVNQQEKQINFEQPAVLAQSENHPVQPEPFTESAQLEQPQTVIAAAAPTPPEKAAEPVQKLETSEISETAIKKPQIPEPLEATIKEPETPETLEATVKEPEVPQPIEATVKEPEAPQPLEATVKEPEAPQPLEATVKEPEAPQPIETTVKEPDAPQPSETTVKEPDAPQPIETTVKEPETSQPLETTVEEPETLKTLEDTAKEPETPEILETTVKESEISETTAKEETPIEPELVDKSESVVQAEMPIVPNASVVSEKIEEAVADMPIVAEAAPVMEGTDKTAKETEIFENQEAGAGKENPVELEINVNTAIEPEPEKTADATVESEEFAEPEIAIDEEASNVLNMPAVSETKQSVSTEQELEAEKQASTILEVEQQVSAMSEPEAKQQISAIVEAEQAALATSEPEAIMQPEAKANPEEMIERKLSFDSEESAKTAPKKETFVKQDLPRQELEKPEISVKQETAEQPEIAIKTEVQMEEAKPSLVQETVKKPEASEDPKAVLQPQALIISDNLVEPEETTKQLEKTENMGIVQEEDITVTTDKVQELLDCDKNRCRLEPYDKDILYDIIRGHWELFEDGAGEGVKGRKIVKTDAEEDSKELIARNPKLDVKQGVVGIDFGTKSTVVVRQDATNRIVPIRIGTGNLSDEVKEEDFENPSIIEFTNVKKFLEDYQREVGRPHTSCNDIFVSYDAYEDFRNCKPDDFYAYFNELKQWANHEKGNVIIKDKQKKEYYMGENMGAAEDIVNPVELYAYYIGLHINNMRNGIYLKYLMTFPVGYAKEVRDFIADSFYEGIKKSLPTSIINDEECMAQFKVELGISEPAAYAVTALEQNHLEPKDETERLMYGIFDFGGGTTDFDFGICRGATDEEYDKDAYDYVLECFGADSDVTLGGENILELMAYQVYQRNIDVFREKKITFTLPLGESGFAGSETLLIDSQIAKRNMAILKEELRPLWHQEQGWRKKYELENEVPNEVDKEGIVVSLYNMDGEPVPQCMLEFSTQEMVEMIKDRIQKGIDSFFQCLIKIFLYKKEDAAEEEPTIYIFLAGNSSRSVFVKELFQKKIEEYYSKSRKAGDEMGNAHFELFEPLAGTQDGSDYYVPNAKTGVAYGLLKSREGSSIKIVKNYETDALQQSRFRYYLGRDRRHYFDCKFSPAEVSYKKWVSFQGASREVVRIYYTDNPVADSKLEQLSIENVPYKEITITPEEDAYLFIRTVEPNLIEYAVAKEEDDILDSEIRNCYFT